MVEAVFEVAVAETDSASNPDSAVLPSPSPPSPLPLPAKAEMAIALPEGPDGNPIPGSDPNPSWFTPKRYTRPCHSSVLVDVLIATLLVLGF
ncbi:hypothetical protein B296_00032034 [Ensete ventricosum]|uniref:Uncharacterized protein n=1 Tax=Ensete ventricosum TaxID=4639 RepID=A0A426ZGP9_ENSVE|nr:hypothetical protein B296_00032034 [Ensete ventricosum]